MDAHFWHQRWKENRIGFHLDQVNPLLTQFWSHLDHSQANTVFVPLCGKSHDLRWLAQQMPRVLGNEISKDALSCFMQEQSLEYAMDEEHQSLTANNITLYYRNFFDLQAKDLEQVTHVYDRAALIALPKEMRQAYAIHLINHLPHPVNMLLITLDYDQSEQDGPPFAVSDQEVHQLFSDHFHIQCLDKQDQRAHAPNRGAPLSRLDERVYHLTSKPSSSR